ncbi:hypothetical protein Scep_026297 [Stephania cephalantha]|uniref:Uncharacterized protein n=1 Tax=Stephania cephalantha TaxID=152367 RepID=A0AAP0HN21_9MAGN
MSKTQNGAHTLVPAGNRWSFKAMRRGMISSSNHQAFDPNVEKLPLGTALLDHCQWSGFDHHVVLNLKFLIVVRQIMRSSTSHVIDQ